MEKILFYAYLQFVKESKETFWPRLLKLPVHILSFLVLSLVCIIGVGVASFFQCPLGVVLFMIGEIVFSLVAYYCLDHYQIITAKLSCDEYKRYCLDLSKRLGEYDLKTVESIEYMHMRLKNNLAEMKVAYDKKNDGLFKWIQTLVIPVVLAVVTTIIAKQNEFEMIVSHATAVIIAFVAIYGLFTTIRNIMLFPVKQKIEQMECLVSDLQGVLDFKNQFEEDN